MAILLFKNKNLRGILRITQQSTIFIASYAEQIQAYQKETGFAYKAGANLDKYSEHTNPTLWFHTKYKTGVPFIDATAPAELIKKIHPVRYLE
jgi:hypothetical protein